MSRYLSVRVELEVCEPPGGDDDADLRRLGAELADRARQLLAADAEVLDVLHAGAVVRRPR